MFKHQFRVIKYLHAWKKQHQYRTTQAISIAIECDDVMRLIHSKSNYNGINKKKRRMNKNAAGATFFYLISLTPGLSSI